MSLLRRIEKAMDHRLRAIFSGGSEEPGAREVIELYREALDLIAARVTVGKRSERLFPFNSITIELMAKNPERKAVLEALFDAGQLVTDICATLNEERATPPADLAVMVHYPEDAGTELRVFCEKTEKPVVPATPKGARAVEIKPARLSTPSLEFTLDRPIINLGRENEVLDTAGQVIRRNDLFFPRAEFEASETVSRRHAHIRFDQEGGDWRIFDDGSSLGTCLFREGRRIDVPGHASRGVALRDGDEINLGQVRLQFELLR
jgi:FHA domain